MGIIRSTNQTNFEQLFEPGQAKYTHGAEKRKGYIPLAFQLMSPYDKTKAMLPHAFVSHVNPKTFSETFNKKIERIQTRGGFVEQHWPDDLGEISATSSTGAFINLQTGLSSLLRHRTIAWDKYQDLYDLYRNNGALYDPYGNIVLQGHVCLMFDRGVYFGYFKTFEMEETEETPFAFTVQWTFKVVETQYLVPLNGNRPVIRLPSFQSQNQTNNLASSTELQGGADAGGTTINAATAQQQQANATLQASAQAILDASKNPTLSSQASSAVAPALSFLSGLESFGGSTNTIPTNSSVTPKAPVKAPVK